MTDKVDMRLFKDEKPIDYSKWEFNTAEELESLVMKHKSLEIAMYQSNKDYDNFQ